MKVSQVAALFSLLATHAMAGEAKQVANVEVGSTLFKSMYAQVYVANDPVVRGVTCHVQAIALTGLTLDADPSNTSIACRQTGKMFAEDIEKVKKGPEGEDIFTAARSGGFGKTWASLAKELRVQRVWDEDTKTLIYISYTAKLYDGSPKTAISTVPTYGQF